ncbi:Oidioi.mRNA.OKI2018_I69.chr1.g3518.t1.cds [Oikopleura dioica]|uniref:Oidioi.mRNA.OKI2018_I69.chr1.g3518.t1.cds n=1 Tax=Oikopleura dioica TaxID=34765 RepID=A0ABN7SUE1_OIKDI|nr:Oidioi.mRNA.OKI2018_I69.chr1.g3518.t1.cds [Oikopleura dioica]
MSWNGYTSWTSSAERPEAKAFLRSVLYGIYMDDVDDLLRSLTNLQRQDEDTLCDLGLHRISMRSRAALIYRIDVKSWWAEAICANIPPQLVPQYAVVNPAAGSLNLHSEWSLRCGSLSTQLEIDQHLCLIPSGIHGKLYRAAEETFSFDRKPFDDFIAELQTLVNPERLENYLRSHVGLVNTNVAGLNALMAPQEMDADGLSEIVRTCRLRRKNVSEKFKLCFGPWHGVKSHAPLLGVKPTVLPSLTFPDFKLVAKSSKYSGSIKIPNPEIFSTANLAMLSTARSTLEVAAKAKNLLCTLISNDLSKKAQATQCAIELGLAMKRATHLQIDPAREIDEAIHKSASSINTQFKTKVAIVGSMVSSIVESADNALLKPEMILWKKITDEDFPAFPWTNFLRVNLGIPTTVITELEAEIKRRTNYSLELFVDKVLGTITWMHGDFDFFSQERAWYGSTIKAIPHQVRNAEIISTLISTVTGNLVQARDAAYFLTTEWKPCRTNDQTHTYDPSPRKRPRNTLDEVEPFSSKSISPVGNATTPATLTRQEGALTNSKEYERLGNLSENQQGVNLSTLSAESAETSKYTCSLNNTSSSDGLGDVQPKQNPTKRNSANLISLVNHQSDEEIEDGQICGE